ncbi:hypothetical protein JW859_08375 [bacterium]|nr:hypothetical protein [bacterium]
MRFAIHCVASVVIYLVCAHPALAQSDDDHWRQVEAARARMMSTQQEVATQRAALEEMPAGEATNEQLDAYYLAALESVDAYLENDVLCMRSVPFTLDEVLLEKGGRYWPGDPLNDWEPLPVQALSDEPRPGGIVLQVCPAEYYSDPDHHGWPAPKSYEVSIYGRSNSVLGTATPAAGNTPWAQATPRMLVMRGHFTPPFTETALPDDDLDALRENARTRAHRRAQALQWYADNPQVVNQLRDGRLRFLLDSVMNIVWARENAEAAREVLETKPRLLWNRAELTDYLSNAMYLVYMSSLGYRWMSKDWACYDLNELLDSRLLPYIPGNPFYNWEPMEIHDSAEPFSAGDIWIRWSSSYYFNSGVDGIEPNTYLLGVYGARDDLPPPAQLQENIDRLRQDWMAVPPGTLWYTYAMTQSLLTTDYNRAVCFS